MDETALHRELKNDRRLMSERDALFTLFWTRHVHAMQTGPRLKTPRRADVYVELRIPVNGHGRKRVMVVCLPPPPATRAATQVLLATQDEAAAERAFRAATWLLEDGRGAPPPGVLVGGAAVAAMGGGPDALVAADWVAEHGGQFLAVGSPSDARRRTYAEHPGWLVRLRGAPVQPPPGLPRLEAPGRARVELKYDGRLLLVD